MNYNSLNYTHRFNLFNDDDDNDNNNNGKGNRIAVILDDCVCSFVRLRVFMQFVHSMSFVPFLARSVAPSLIFFLYLNSR